MYAVIIKEKRIEKVAYLVHLSDIQSIQKFQMFGIIEQNGEL